MAETRRPAEESKILLIEAAVDIIHTEGYGALTARRLAERVGLKRQIVHYYFGTIEDLLLAVVRHYGDYGLERFSEAIKTKNPLQVIWEIEADASATSFAFMAMATHHPIIRAEMRKYLEKMRKLQVEALDRYFAERGLRPAMPSIASIMIIQYISQALAAESDLGTTLGHADAQAVVDKLLKSIQAGGQDFEAMLGGKGGAVRSKTKRSKRRA
jgi:AcrR family transcriptional regulator